MNRVIRYQGAIIRDHYILLIKVTEHASGHSFWLIPGGGIESGEIEEACVEREMLEETGLRVRVERLLLDEPSPPGDTYQRSKTYVCAVLEGEARPGHEPEPEYAALSAITEVGWFDLRRPATWSADMVQNPIIYTLVRRIQGALGYAVADVAPSAQDETASAGQP